MIVLGVGTGRSGTKSLSRLLSAAEGVEVTHEGRSAGLRPLPWSASPGDAVAHLTAVIASLPEGPIVGDVASFYLPHLSALSDHFGDVAVIFVKRDCERVADSFLRKTIARNLWQEHRGLVYRRDPVWEPAFPKADPELTKRDAILWYCDSYHRSMAEFADSGVAPVFQTNTDDLGRQETLDDLAGFLRSRSHHDVVLRPQPAANQTSEKHRPWIPDSLRYLRIRLQRGSADRTYS